MTDDVKSKRLDDLEVSVRAFELLSSLGVDTVGELLALPRIEMPTIWPVKISRLVAREIQEVIAELGEQYRGEIVIPAPREATLKATGDVKERWATIAAWLEKEHPHALAQFHPPATEDAIAAAEAQLGVVFPADYRAFLSIHNGQNHYAPMVGLGPLSKVEAIAETRGNIFGEETAIDPELAGEGVRAVEYSRKWIPITLSARGRDNLCLDLDPAPGGQVGQIIEYIADADERPLIAKSFADLLSKYFEQAQTGEIDLREPDDDDDE
jgi:cell wall assembly regulator SMI1